MNIAVRLPALALAASVALAPAAGWADDAPAAKPAKPVASVTSAATRGITLKVALTSVTMGIFYAGTGSVMTSGAVSAMNAVSSYALYVANEFMWDKLSPPPQPTAAGETFDPAASAWRNTMKFMTFKPAVMLTGWATLYAWTGSLSTTLTYGGLVSVVAPGVFYANNMAWDWYDWYAAQLAEPGPPTRRTLSMDAPATGPDGVPGRP